MAIEFVGSATDNKAGATSGNTTISLTSGLTDGIASAASEGDFVIAAFATSSVANRVLSITPGTLVDSELFSDDTNDTNLRVVRFFVGPSDTAVTFGPTGNANDAGAMAVYVFRGVDPTTPLDVAAVPATGINTGIPDPSFVLPSTAGAYVFAVGAGSLIGSAGAFTSSLSGFKSTRGSDTYDVIMGTGYTGPWVSGNVNPAQFGLSGTTDSTNYSWGAMTVALRPAPVAYSVTADAGSLGCTGTAANLERGREVLAGPGSYAVTGQPANLERGREVLALAGAFSYSGQAASLELGREVLALAGAYAFTGTDASLEYGRNVIAEAGAFTFNGQDASLEYGRALLAGDGSYAFTGVDVDLEYGREIAGDAGSYIFTGPDATLTKAGVGARTLSAEAGAFAFTGANADLEYGREIVADPGAYAFTGEDATIIKGGGLVNRYIGAEPGSFGFTGPDATLQHASIVVRQPSGGRWVDWLPRPPRPADVSEDDTPKPKRKKRRRIKADTIELAPDGPVEVQTGVVEVVPAWDALIELQRIQVEAAEARRQRLRAIALADDEWLMMQ